MKIVKSYALPEVGTDWLPGLEDCYIVLAPHECKPGKPAFWKSMGHGYTGLVNAGIFPIDSIADQPWVYNNGLNSVAIPLTKTALQLLDIKITIDLSNLAVFANSDSPNVTSGPGS